MKQILVTAWSHCIVRIKVFIDEKIEGYGSMKFSFRISFSLSAPVLNPIPIQDLVPTIYHTYFSKYYTHDTRKVLPFLFGLGSKNGDFWQYVFILAILVCSHGCINFRRCVAGGRGGMPCH